MSGAQTADTLWFVLAFVLVGSALAARRFSWRSALGMVLAWGAIFAVVLVAVSYRRELGMVVNRVRSEVTGTPHQQVVGGALRIAVSADGHYWVDGTIDGMPARFLIDSGATITALSRKSALAAGLRFGKDGRAPLVMQTANGPVDADRATVGLLRIGPVTVSRLAVVVSPAFGDVNVIGMNLLSSLSSWQVKDGEMILRP